MLKILSFKLPFKGNFVHSIHLYYRCKVIGGEISTEFLDEQEQKYAGEAEWVELEKLKEIKFCSSVDVEKILMEMV